MDKKKIYIIVIVVCVLITAGVLYWSSQDPSAGLPDNIAPINTDIDRVDPASSGRSSGANMLPAPEMTEDYTAPRVFPVDTQINLGVFDSSKYTSLTDYVPLTVQPEEVGRENPFISY
jgi:hypothetical protein